MNFKTNYFTQTHFSLKIKFGDQITFILKITLNILLINKSVNKQVTPNFMIGLHFQEICIDSKHAGLYKTVSTDQLCTKSLNKKIITLKPNFKQD